MRLALVFNSFSYKLHEENLRVVQKYFGLFPPLSMSWVAAIAERAGHECILIDARTLQLTKDEVLERLRQFKPDILGMMMTTYMYRESIEWMRYLKRHLKIPTIVGGYNLRVYPRESVADPAVDYGCLQSAYFTVPALFEVLEHGGRLSDVPGLIYKQDGRIFITPEMEERFDDYPNPARHLLPNELYAEFPTERKNFTVMVTTKGCYRRCTFCEAGGTSRNARSPMRVADEMEECYRKFGIREIDIFDYEFPSDRKRTKIICQEIKRRGLDIWWACRSRVDSVNEDLLREMSSAGCRRIYYGIEFGEQEMLDKVKKGITPQQVRDTIKMTQEYGIKALGFFLIGGPDEDRQSIRRTVKFAKSLDLEYVQFSKLTAKPLTTMWHDMVLDSGHDYWRDYILGLVEEAALDRPWTELTNQEIDDLARWAYVKYHSRPMFLIRSALRVRSFTEFKRKFFAYLDMVFRQERTSEAWLEKDEEFVAYNENAQVARRPRFPVPG